MKTPSFLSNLRFHGVVALAISCISALAADDPFIKAAAPEPGAGPADITAPLPETVLSLQSEVFSLPIEVAHQVLALPNDTARRDAVIERLGRGATLMRLVVMRSKSGQRALVDSSTELRYATEFQQATIPVPPEFLQATVPVPQTDAKPSVRPPAPGFGAFPTLFVSSNIGHILEAEMIFQDGVLATNAVVSEVTVVSYSPDPFRIPVLDTQKITTSVTMIPGKPLLFGTLNPPPTDPEKSTSVWLVFFTGTIVPENKGGESHLELAKRIIIPNIDLRETSPSEAIDFLRERAKTLDPAQQGVNIVLKLPPSLAASRITISLRNIPLYEALRYIASLSNLEITAQPSVIILHPREETPQ